MFTNVVSHLPPENQNRKVYFPFSYFVVVFTVFLKNILFLLIHCRTFTFFLNTEVSSDVHGKYSLSPVGIAGLNLE